MIYGFGLAAFCIAWLWPGHYVPWISFQQETAAAIGALLFALACLVSTGRDALRVPAISLGALLLAAVPMLQWAVGKVDFLADALLPALYLVAFGLTVVAARAVASRNRERLVFALMVTLLVGALVSNLIGLGQGLRLGWEAHVEQLGSNGRVFGNFTQPNLFAVLLAMGLVATWWLYESRRVSGWCAILIAIFLFLGMAMTQSRIAWGFFAFFAIWWLLNRRRAQLRSRLWALASALIVFATANVLWPTLSLLVDGSAVMSTVERTQTIGGRKLLWPVLWDAAWRQPWTGWGWMQIGAAEQAAVLDHAPVHEWFTYSHSLVLDLFLWIGIPGGVIILAAGTWWIVTRARRCSDLDTWALLAAGGIILVHSLVEFPYAYAFFLLPLAVIVGAIEAQSAAPLNAVFAIPRPLFAIAIAGMAAMLWWICAEYLVVEDMARRTRFKEAGYVVPASAEPAPPDVVLIDSQREFIRVLLIRARPGMTAEELSNMRRINRRFMPPSVMLRIALAMGLNGEREEALRNLRLLCHIWTVEQCEEGRKNWQELQLKYPQLQATQYPTPIPAR